MYDDYGGSGEVRARFATKTAVLDLGRFDLTMRRNAERNFTICVSKPPFGGPSKNTTLWQSLRVERLQPKDKTYKAFAALTLPVFVEAEEMPATALGYTPYDFVLLEGDGFALLRGKHRAALKRWVLGGGSLCVKTSGAIEASHRRFLTELFAADAREIVLAFDADGRLEANARDGVLLARPGFGRLVVASRVPESDAEADGDAWKRAAMFFWKVHGVRIEGALPEQPWRWEPKDMEPWRGHQPRQNLGAILAPKHVQIMPVFIVLTVLCGFLLVVGPLDSLVLGRLRLRRLTWITLPLAAAAFTAITVFLAGYYMGRSNESVRR